ncbi:MAG: cytochrome c3 family protein, partial [Coriobacteriia bacterium]|nr:cytochrome c3 family protein [Coriobacteriia bacterium]
MLGRFGVRSTVVIALAMFFALGCVGVANGYDEIVGYPPVSHSGGDCETCHVPLTGVREACGGSGAQCHTMFIGYLDAASGKGPHGLYSKTSDRCGACHTVHASTGAKLLPAATVTSSCFVCHDGTGGRGVYGAIYARTSVQPQGGHRYNQVTSVPGGSSTNGGSSSTLVFKGDGGTLSCGDCHSPHDSNTVTPYRVERWRSSYSNVRVNPLTPGLTYRNATTSHLLRRNPGGSTATATVYGSDWCLACHAGRGNTGSLHNHPVDTTLTAGGDPFTYDSVALLASDTMTDTTVLGSMAETNRGYLMPFPRTPEQGTHTPICQQCHEDTRNVGVLSAAGTQAQPLPSTI